MSYREVNKGGLGQLYEILLESSAVQILLVLKVVLRASEAGRPVLFFCKVKNILDYSVDPLAYCTSDGDITFARLLMGDELELVPDLNTCLDHAFLN